jgi:PTH2 family peptidyl-tRNA hydrolase
VEEYKMKLAIIIRKDLEMRTGKIAGQVGHASVMAYRMASATHEGEQWYQEGQKKIILKVYDEEILLKLGGIAILNQLQVNSVRDFGLTQIAPDTLTCIAIGPDEDEKIDAVTKGLSLL